MEAGFSGTIRTRGDVLEVARRLYAEAPAGPRLLQGLRPYICPFEELVRRVPAEARVLDVGCGAGLLLGLLARDGRIAAGTGFDMSGAAISAARTMAARHFSEGTLSFRHQEAEAPWPDGPFDVVCLIDVLHHVAPSFQREVVLRALDHVRPGGLLLYKDMAVRPRWMAAWNRLHDLVLARQWIRYRPLPEVRGWLEEAGCEIREEARFDRLAYGHEMLLAARPA